jgi:putative ABC transport system permease protein
MTDVRLCLRTLRRQPAFTLTTVMTLGLAIAIATSVFGVLHTYLIRPLPFPEPDRLVQVIAGPSREQFTNPPSLTSVDWRAANTVFAQTVAWDLDGFTLAGGDRPEFVDGAWVSPGYFTVLGLRPAIGRGFLPAEYEAGAQVAVISHALWMRRYRGDSSLVGTTIRAHSTDRPRESEMVTVVGVMPADAWHLSRFTDVLRPLSTPRIPSLARLVPGMTIGEAERRLNAAVLPQLRAVPSQWRMSLVSAQDEYTYQVRPVLIAACGAALFLLLIGAASVAGAQVARAAARRAEIEVRMALGASRRRITAQLLTESLVISLSAGLTGGALAMLTLGSVGAMAGEHLGAAVPGGPDKLGLGGMILAAGIGISTAIGVAFGLLPALSVSRDVRSSSITTSAGKGSAVSTLSPSLRRVLVVTQVAFTVILLAGAGLMSRSLLAIGGEPLGFEPEGVVKAELLLPLGRYPNPSSRRDVINRVISAVDAAPGVRAVAFANPHPFRGVPQPAEIVVEGSTTTTEAGPRAVTYIVTPAFFDVLGIPILEGRRFGQGDDRQSALAAIVSEQLAHRLWPGLSPIGRRLRVGADSSWRSVIGVVGDMRESVAAQQQSADVYLPYAQMPRAFVSLLAAVDNDPARVGATLRDAVAGVDDVLALASVEPMTDLIARESQRPRALVVVLTVFAALALGVAMLGLYASLAYVVIQRRREIAIRVAVGASAAAIGRLIAGEAAALVVLGLIAGTALGLMMTRILSTLLYGVALTDGPTYAATAVLLGVAALAASLAPVRRATGIAPAEIMRGE